MNDPNSPRGEEHLYNFSPEELAVLEEVRRNLWKHQAAEQRELPIYSEGAEAAAEYLRLLPHKRPPLAETAEGVGQPLLYTSSDSSSTEAKHTAAEIDRRVRAIPTFADLGSRLGTGSAALVDALHSSVTWGRNIPLTFIDASGNRVTAERVSYVDENTEQMYISVQEAGTERHLFGITEARAPRDRHRIITLTDSSNMSIDLSNQNGAWQLFDSTFYKGMREADSAVEWLETAIANVSKYGSIVAAEEQKMATACQGITSESLELLARAAAAPGRSRALPLPGYSIRGDVVDGRPEVQIMYTNRSGKPNRTGASRPVLVARLDSDTCISLTSRTWDRNEQEAKTSFKIEFHRAGEAIVVDRIADADSEAMQDLNPEALQNILRMLTAVRDVYCPPSPLGRVLSLLHKVHTPK